MSSKGKKLKKKPKSGLDGVKLLLSKKINAFFTNEEVLEIKSALKVKDLTGLPFAIGAAILNKPDLLKRFLKDGHNINQTGQNNMTALMWAIKFKYLDLVDYLLMNGADPTIKTDNGDNALILALEHKLWDEQSYITFWNTVKLQGAIDANVPSKNGHNMVHMCVRRDWETFLETLLVEQPNLDAPNSNGVTPLMMACFRNNFNIVDILISNGANILKEDHYGRIALCYAISSAMKASKNLQIVNKIMDELSKQSSFHIYLKKRLEIVISNSEKLESSSGPSEMFFHTIQYAVHYKNDGLDILLHFNVFQQLFKAMKILLNKERTKFLLEVCGEILFYNVQSVGFNTAKQNYMLEEFYTSGLLDLLLDFLKCENSGVATAAFNLIILSCASQESWLKTNYHKIVPHMKIVNFSQQKIQDQSRFRILKNKLKRIRRLIDNIGTVIKPIKDKISDNTYSKKAKRKTKAFRARLARIKSAEFTKRLSLTGKKQRPKIVKADQKMIGDDLLFNGNPIVASLQHLLVNVDSQAKKDRFVISDSFPEWKQKILQLPFDYNPHNDKELSEAVAYLKKTIRNGHHHHHHHHKKLPNNYLNTITDYLKSLLQLIISKYEQYWECEKQAEHCTCLEINEHDPRLYKNHLGDIEIKERDIIWDLERNMDLLIATIDELSDKDLGQYLRCIRQLEVSLLKHEVRGIKLLSHSCSLETVLMKPRGKLPANLFDYIEKILNDLEQPNGDIEIEIFEDVNANCVSVDCSENSSETTYRDSLTIDEVKSRSFIDQFQSTFTRQTNSFHLIDSIMALCDDASHNYSVTDLDKY